MVHKIMPVSRENTLSLSARRSTSRPNYEQQSSGNYTMTGKIFSHFKGGPVSQSFGGVRNTSNTPQTAWVYNWY